MATPKLKTGNAAAAPVRTLRPSGTAPAAAPKLKSATGKTITPKKAPAPAKAAAPKAAKPATPAPEIEETTSIAAEAVTPEIAPIEEIAAPMEEAPVEAPLTPEEEEAARLAQEEYERQMEEYNRQMEEYNRQMAELQAAQEAEIPAEGPVAEEPCEEPAATHDEEAAAAAEAAQAMVEDSYDEDEPTPNDKLRAAKGSKKNNLSVSSSKKKKKAKPADEDNEESDEENEEELSEEELAQREAYIKAILEEEQRQPIWKTVPFMIGGGILVATIALCTVLVVQKQAENARIQAHIDYTNTLLRRAQQINMQGVENQADAAKKKVDVTCTMEDAKALMEVVVDPFVKGENDKPRYGARAEGVAQNACLLLGLAAENNDAIRDMIFDTMGKNCVKIKPTLFHWLLQRIAISDAKGVNAGFKKLSKVVAEKKTAKPWAKKTQILAYIWESIGLRVTSNDTKEILDLLKSDIADPTLAVTLCNCLDNILMMMDDTEAKAALGDDIFTHMPEKLRNNPTMVSTLARACSTKALEYYKEQITSGEGWSGPSPIFFGMWGNDDILEYIMEQKTANEGKGKILACINDVLGTILKQDRPRSIESAETLLKTCFQDPYGSTANIQDIINKTDPDSSLYIGDTHPDLPKLKEQYDNMQKLRKQKVQIIRMLSGLCDHEWVTTILKKYTNDPDEEVQYEASKASQKVLANSVNMNQMREAYKKRLKD